MKSIYQTSKGFFYLLVIYSVSMSLIECKKEIECHDIDYGQQKLIQDSISLYPYKNGDDLVFKDSLNNELKLKMVGLGISHGYTGYAQPVEEGECGGMYKALSHMEYFLSNFRNDSLDYLIICDYFVNSIIADQLPRYFDVFGMFISTDEVNSGISLNHVTNYRSNEIYLHDTIPSYIFEETKTLGSKIFPNVYSKTKSHGRFIAYNHTSGLLAFQLSNGVLWILDRIE